MILKMVSWQNSKFAIGVLLVFFLLSACSGGKEKHSVATSYAKWDNPISVSEYVIPAFTDDEDSVLISDGTVMLVNKDKLFIEDYKSLEKMIHVVDIPSRQYVGAFGNFGDGPNEILQPGNMFVLPDNRLAVIDYGHWCVKSFDVDSALNNADYSLEILVRLSESESKIGFPDRFVPIQDGRGIGRLIKSKDSGGYSQTLCSFDVFNGRIEPFGNQDNPKGFRSSVAASGADSLVVEVSSTQDVIRIYDLEGNVKREINGPLYESRPSRELAFYSNVALGDGKIFAVYSGESKFTDFCGKQIVVFTLDGKYLYSYKFDDHIRDISYSDEYGRLYFSTDGNIQFGYLQLGDEVSAGGIRRSDIATLVKDDNPRTDSVNLTKQEVTMPPLTLIDPDIKEKQVPVSKADIKPYRESDSAAVRYYVPIANQSLSDTIRIDSISASIPCEISRIPKFPLIPKLMVPIILTPDEVPVRGDVILTVYYNGKIKQELRVNLLNIN